MPIAEVTVKRLASVKFPRNENPEQEVIVVKLILRVSVFPVANWSTYD